MKNMRIKTMSKSIFETLLSITLFFSFAVPSFSQNKTGLNLPVQLEELTAVELIDAVKQADKVCLIPIGVLEKHGPHLPLGTDLLDVRQVALRAAKQEYVVIFPQYYFSQIFEAKHQPGAIAYSSTLIWSVLQETCDELSRNGFEKIIIVNGHGGNNHFLPFFCQAQLANRKNYAVFLFEPTEDPETEAKMKPLRHSTFDSHAGETEISTLLTHRPDLVHLDLTHEQDGSDQHRLDMLKNTYTAIWWFARFPNHYASDGSAGTRELGEKIIQNEVDQLIEMIRSVKKNKEVLKLQEEFYDESEQPLKTKQ
jgi:creatinine amidohydrolase